MSRKLLSLLDALYPSILEAPPWVSFLEALEQALPAHHGTMVLRKPRDGDPGVLVSTDGDSAALVALQERVFSDSPFLELPEGEVCTLGEMMSEAELLALHPEYHRYLGEHGDVADLIGLDLRDPDTGVIGRLRAARRRGEAPFGAGERKLLRDLKPRLATALRLYARQARQQYRISIADEAVDRLAIGSLLLDEQGVVLIKNPVADRLLQQEDGLYLRDGRLHCIDAGDDELLYRRLKALRNLSQREPGDAPGVSLRVSRHPLERRWSLLLRPAPARPGLEERTRGTVLVLLRDAGETPDISSALLMELFGLTPAEARLTERLVKGESLNEAAAALARSRYTARAQLTAVFAKTNTHRQPQLVSHVLNTVSTVWK